MRSSCIDGGLPQTTHHEEGKGTVLPRDGLNPRIGLPYTYLMAWFALYCSAIIQPEEEPPEGVRTVHLHRFEGSSWSWIYVAAVHKLLCCHDVYSLFQCFPYIRDTGYGEEFKNVRDGRTLLSCGVFEWLVSIRPSHLVYRSGDICYLDHMSPAALLASLDMTNSTMVI